VLPAYDLLLMERAFASGVGNDVNVYGVILGDATELRDLDALPSPFAGQLARKTLLANLTALGVTPDNLEAMALGPVLPNGHPTLLLMSDDNFSAAGSPQINQFVLFEIVAP
jgi:3-phytase/alkaline phosphatase D